MKGITVQQLYEDDKYGLGLKLIAGKAGLQRKIFSRAVQKPGLAFAGQVGLLHPDRVQVVGYSEITYLRSLSPSLQQEAIAKVCDQPICCLIITGGQEIPPAFIELAEEKEISLFSTDLFSSVFIARVGEFLADQLAETTTVHGVFLEVHGVGILLVGESGIGKSECALDLIMRGHRLVADDVVEVRKKSGPLLSARAVKLIKDHLEIRGLGIVNARDLFGIASICEERPLDLVIEFVDWLDEELDRLGAEGLTYRLLEVELPLLRVPIRPGRNMTSLVEIAARNFLLEKGGRRLRGELEEKIKAAILSQEGEED